MIKVNEYLIKIKLAELEYIMNHPQSTEAERNSAIKKREKLFRKLIDLIKANNPPKYYY